MTKRTRLSFAILVLGVSSLAACEQTLRTGRVGNKNNPPNPDGTCSTGLTVCGTGAFARCLDLQNDRAHCGTCDRACVEGIACAAGACQQVACTGPVTVSAQTIPGTAPTSTPYLGGALLADVNGDGRPDLVTWRVTSVSDGTGMFQVALGEAGGFDATSTYQVAHAVRSIVAADTNSDGLQDLYITDSNSVTSPCVDLWLGRADGKLTPTTTTGAAGCASSIVLADLNGDGTLDMVASAQDQTVFLADANGTFHDGTSYAARGSAWSSKTLVLDWNGDGAPDLVVLSQMLILYLNKGNGTFEDELDCGAVTNPDQTVIADFNRDGHLDLATGLSDSVGVLLGMGGCQFQPLAEYLLPDIVHSLVHGDLNGDGVEDLVIDTMIGSVVVLFGGADGVFQVDATPLLAGSSGTNQHVLLVGDVTGDGKADIVVATETVSSVQGPEPTQILENTCP